MRARILVLVLVGLLIGAVQPAQAMTHSTAHLAKKKKCKKKRAKKCKKRKETPAPAQALPPNSPLGPSAPQVARIVVSPAGILLTGEGDTAQLAATPVDAQGDPIGGLPAATWTSDDPGTVSISGSGLASASAVSGAAQIRATIGGVSSSPILATVAAPAAGAKLITDASVVSGPTLSDPDAPGSFATTFFVILTGVSPPAIGDLIIDTENKPIVGRVVAVEDLGSGQFKVTLEQVSIEEAFPDLQIDELIDLSGAEADINPEIADDYSVSRSGDRFVFTPKSGSTFAGTGPSPRAGTSALPPFSECEVETTPSSSSLPIQLEAPPLFSVEFDPSLDIEYTLDGDLEKLAVDLEPSISIEGGIEIAAAFEGKVECKVELFVLRAPVGGPLSVFISGLIPIGVGIEAAGKMNIADAGVKTKVEVSGNAEAGISCPPSDPEDDCSFTGSMSASADVEPELNAPSIGDLRFEPSLEAFASAELSVGNPLLTRIRFDTAEAKAGAKLEGSFASKTSQIAADDYKSDYGASVEASATIGTELEDVAELLGLGEITGLGITVSNDLAHSPSGTLGANHTTFQTGDLVKFVADLTGTNFFPALGPYNVSKVVLVRNSGGSVTQAASQNASSGQTKFEFDYTAPDSGNVDEFYAFVVTKLLPFDIFSLELARASGQDLTVDVSPSSATLGPNATQQFTATVQNAISNTAVTWSASCGSINSSGLYTAPSSGGPCTVTATSVEDPTKSDDATVTLTPSGGTVQVVDRIVRLNAFGGCFPNSDSKSKESPADLPLTGSFSDSLTASGSCDGVPGGGTSSQQSDVEPAAADAEWLDVNTTQSVSGGSGSTLSRHQTNLLINGPITLSCTGSYSTSGDNINIFFFVVNPSNNQIEQNLVAKPAGSNSGSIDTPVVIPSGSHAFIVQTGLGSSTGAPSSSGESHVSCTSNGTVTTGP